MQWGSENRFLNVYQVSDDESLGKTIHEIKGMHLIVPTPNNYSQIVDSFRLKQCREGKGGQALTCQSAFNCKTADCTGNVC